jgi:hypothetical protein
MLKMKTEKTFLSKEFLFNIEIEYGKKCSNAISSYMFNKKSFKRTAYQFGLNDEDIINCVNILVNKEII